MMLNIDNSFILSISLNMVLETGPMKRLILESRAQCPLYSAQRTWLLLISSPAEGIDML